MAEPNPEVANKFLTKRSRDKFINAGIGVDNGHLDYYKYLIPALNTFSKEAVVENRVKGFNIDRIEKIKILAVKSFLDKYVDKKIDFLTLDTEGMDFQILKNWDWMYRPKVICVEKDGDKRIEKLLIEKGYKLAKETKYNLIFLKN